MYSRNRFLLVLSAILSTLARTIQYSPSPTAAPAIPYLSLSTCAIHPRISKPGPPLVSHSDLPTPNCSILFTIKGAYVAILPPSSSLSSIPKSRQHPQCPSMAACPQSGGHRSQRHGRSKESVSWDLIVELSDWRG